MTFEGEADKNVGSALRHLTGESVGATFFGINAKPRSYTFAPHEAAMRKFLPEHVITICSRDAPLSSVPFATVESEGIAAVVDISGFTALTNHLLDIHGADGAAILRETLKAPFSKIIERIYRRSGAIVKFAGDAAIACWSTNGSSAGRRTRILESFACCLELLNEFREVTRVSEDTLGIHIGIGIGHLYHIHVGKLATNLDGSDRREYFIAGEAVSDAGSMVNLGHRGDLVLSSKYYQVLSSTLTGSPGAYYLQMLSDPKIPNENAMVTIKDSSSYFASAVIYFDQYFPDQTPAANEKSMDNSMALTYVEASVAAFIVESGFTVDLDHENYSDTRNATVVFFRFPNVIIDHEGMKRPGVPPAALSIVQKISQEVIACVDAEGGSLRQINFDDKGFSALAVWGLRGLAHQRGEIAYALAACLQLFSALRSENSISSQYFFTAGVASGTIYAGLIGSPLRADGTVLGSPVNIAARLMCMEDALSDTKFPIILCDGPTYESSKNGFEFTKITRRIKLKGVNSWPGIGTKLDSGISDGVTVYRMNKVLPTRLLDPTKEVDGGNDELFGRAAELEAIHDVAKTWKTKPHRKIMLLTGRSGLGKSSLLIRLRNELKQSPTVLCECTDDEVKQRMSFGALLHIFRCISTQLRSFGIKPDAFRFGENRKSSSSDSPLVSRSSKLAFGSKTSLVVLPEIIDTEWAYLEKVMEALGISRATSRLLAIIPGMKAFQVNERLPGGDLTGRIAFIIYQVLEMARTLGFHSCFICDDIQWFDFESHKVLQSVMKFSQSALFVFSGRTQEV
ncbi:hypothetical protein DFJ73DRAFT_770120 [Zopfochytrium polystomum]|nr:hypothetical protein DFJ73DRAFT_770120 [Zopfochytrium polystomum]